MHLKGVCPVLLQAHRKSLEFQRGNRVNIVSDSGSGCEAFLSY